MCLDIDDLKFCRTYRGALHKGIELSKKLDYLKDIANAIGKGKSYVTQVMNEGSIKNFNFEQIRLIELELGNSCISQWLGLKLDGALVHQKSYEEYRALTLIQSPKDKPAKAKSMPFLGDFLKAKTA